MSCRNTPNLLGKEARPEGATNTDEPLIIDPNDGGSGMTAHTQYSDSAYADKTEQYGNWQSIGELAARLVRK